MNNSNFNVPTSVLKIQHLGARGWLVTTGKASSPPRMRPQIGAFWEYSSNPSIAETRNQRRPLGCHTAAPERRLGTSVAAPPPEAESAAWSAPLHDRRGYSWQCVNWFCSESRSGVVCFVGEMWRKNGEYLWRAVGKSIGRGSGLGPEGDATGRAGKCFIGVIVAPHFLCLDWRKPSSTPKWMLCFWFGVAAFKFGPV